MIITDRFIYLHMPKTGGTFVETVLKQIHRARGDEVIEIPRRRPWTLATSFRALTRKRKRQLIDLHCLHEGFHSQHGWVSDIPKEHRHKPIITTIRNPYDRYVSQYEFRWWASHLSAFADDPEAVTRRFPSFPDIGFSDFIHLANTEFIQHLVNSAPVAATLGWHSAQFAQFYFTAPSRVALLTDRYIDERKYVGDISANIHFLSQDDLNRQLSEFLLTVGYTDAEVEPIRTRERIYPPEGGRKDNAGWQDHYSTVLKDYVRHRERMLFDLFPEFDS